MNRGEGRVFILNHHFPLTDDKGFAACGESGSPPVFRASTQRPHGRFFEIARGHFKDSAHSVHTRSHGSRRHPICERAESLSVPFRGLLDTMTEWRGAGLFIFQLWPEAPDTPADRGEMKKRVQQPAAPALYLPRDLAYPPAVRALPLNANNVAAECGPGEEKELARASLRLQEPSMSLFPPAEDLEAATSGGICMAVNILLSVRILKD